MSRRLEKVNRHIQRTLGDIFLEEADIPVGALVTISRVDTTPNLKSAAVWLYIQPLGREEEVLAALKGQLYDLQGALNRALAMRPLPRIVLRIDHGGEHAQRIEKKLAEIRDQDESA